MKTVNTSINLYSFNELSELAKQKAIEKHRTFLLSSTYPSDFEYPEDYDSTIEDYEQNDENIIDNIEANEYIFFENGDLAKCTTYTGKHEKSGITEFTFLGSTYII